jgi:hypothetical protein
MPRAERELQTTIERHARRAATRQVAALLALAGLALTVQGCREEEQDRPLVYDKGTYLGQHDQQLDQDQVEALRRRATEQQI